MTNVPIDLAEKLSSFSEHWSPKVVARLNDYEIKVVKVKGGGVGDSNMVVEHDSRREPFVYRDQLQATLGRIRKLGPAVTAADGAGVTTPVQLRAAANSRRLGHYDAS